jgi:hypothetical protein
LISSFGDLCVTISDSNGFDNRYLRVLILFDKKDGCRLPLQFTSEMAAKLQSIKNEVQHTNYAGFIDSRQTVQFIDYSDTFRLVVSTSYKVSYPVNNNHLNATELIIEFIHALHDRLQPFFSRHRGKAVGLEAFGHGILFPAL